MKERCLLPWDVSVYSISTNNETRQVRISAAEGQKRRCERISTECSVIVWLKTGEFEALEWGMPSEVFVTHTVFQARVLFWETELTIGRPDVPVELVYMYDCELYNKSISFPQRETCCLVHGVWSSQEAPTKSLTAERIFFRNFMSLRNYNIPLSKNSIINTKYPLSFLR